MIWKEYNKHVEVETENGIEVREELVKLYCKQDWLPNCEYRIVPMALGTYRGSFNFKDSEEYLIMDDDLDRVKKFCQNHLNKIKSN